MKIEQTLREALRITLKIWPYGLLQLAFGFSSLLYSRIVDPIALLCLSMPISLLTYLVGILFYRVMFYAMDEKDLHFSSVTQGLMRPAGRVLGLTIASTLIIALLFILVGMAVMLFFIIVAAGVPQLQNEYIFVVMLFACAILLLPLFLPVAIYSPMIMGAIIDRDQTVGNALREAHSIVKAEWKKLFGWVLLLTLPNTVLAVLVGLLTQQTGDVQPSAFLAYIAVMIFGLFLQTAWAVIYRQFSKSEAAPKARRARVSS
ncbi:MAG: hypothetical protein KIS88_10090 [Anaerolineales bacterium]|nr:hypothetical protein [Anaerolineales bacterium]